MRDVDFDPSADPDRNVVLYGNAETNTAWNTLLSDSPVQMSGKDVRIGKNRMKGDDLGILLIRPRPGSDIASVGVVGGTGVRGMRMTDRRPYMHPGFAYPDLTLLRAGGDGIVYGAGFFGLDWSVEGGEFVWNYR
jgi:hypothetical protein